MSVWEGPAMECGGGGCEGAWRRWPQSLVCGAKSRCVEGKGTGWCRKNG